MTTTDLVTSAILSRIKKPVGIIQVRVIAESLERELKIDVFETEGQLLQRLAHLEETMVLQKELKNRSNWLYMIRLAGPTGVVLLILGLIISIYGWINGLVSVGIAGLGPWAVVLTDVLSRIKKKP